MPTLSKTIGTSGADYTTLAAWYSDIQNQIGGTNLVALGYTSVTGTVITDLSGSTGPLLDTVAVAYNTDASHTITLTATAQNYSGGLLWTTGSGPTITCSDAANDTLHHRSGFFFKFIGLRVQNTGGHYALNANGGAAVAKCVFNVTAGGNGVVSSAGGATWNNSLFYLSGANRNCTAEIYGNTDAFSFCTFAVPSDLGGTIARVIYIPSTASLMNCAIFGGGTTTTFNDGGGTPTFSHCASDFTGTLPSGVAGPYTYANQFTGTTIAGGLDYREKNASANLYQGGVTIGGITTDIAGTIRKAAPDIGAWEIAAAAGGCGSRALLGVGCSIGWRATLPLAAAWRIGKGLENNPVLSRRKFLTF